MPALPETTFADPTLEAVDRAIEARDNAHPDRPYLGMSALGGPCERALWYGFRWCGRRAFDASTLKRFEDGHRGEDVQAERLRLVQGITLHTINPWTGKQFGFSAIGGHLRGHMDGAIIGLLQAKKTWHVWEHKQTDEDKQAKLVKIKGQLGEKAALAAWDETYHGQAQLYMHFTGLTLHYLTCATPGGRSTVSVRTDADPAVAYALLARAERIISSSEPPERISERPDWWQCKWCDWHPYCHGGKVAQANCRTCCHATPVVDEGDAGAWRCERYACEIQVEPQRLGCADHLLIPALIPWGEVVDADPAANRIDYRVKGGGKAFANGPRPAYASSEIAWLSPSLIGDAVLEGLRTAFDGVIQEAA